MTKDFNYYADWVMNHIRTLIQEAEEGKREGLEKSFSFQIDMLLEKSRGFPPGTIREWRGEKYKKLGSGKWARFYGERNSRADITGIARSLNNLGRNIEMLRSDSSRSEAEKTAILDRYISDNIERFKDKSGNILKEARELHEMAVSYRAQRDVASRKEKRAAWEAKTSKAVFDKKQTAKTLSNWATQENFDKAKAMSRDEIFHKFDRKTKAIAVLPPAVKDYFGLLGNGVMCSQAYFVEHMAKHHPEVDLQKYSTIQALLDNAKDVYEDTKTGSVLFVREDGAKKDVLALKKDGDNLVFHKTFYGTSKKLSSKMKKISLAKEQGLMSGGDEHPPIGRAEAPASGSIISGRPDSPNIPDNSADVKESLNAIKTKE